MINIQKNVGSTQLPAGVLIGTEIFELNGEPWAVHQGVRVQFNELPKQIQRIFYSKFLKDTEAHQILKEVFGIKELVNGLKKWLCCRYGGYDFKPDLINERLQAVEYNNNCTNYNCKARGRLCKNPCNLSNHEIQTLQEIQAGKKNKEICETLCISLPGLNNRTKNIFEKLEVNNKTHAAVKAFELGIKPSSPQMY